MDPNGLIKYILVYAIPILFAITLHEAAHGFVARRFGDSTAWMLGRVTLNPLRHIDPIGTVLLPILTLAFSPFMFGWAKPVPVNFANLRPGRTGMFWVAAAGPLANLAQVALWAVVAAVLARTIDPSGLAGPFWLSIADAGMKVNIMFALLNLIPVLPLDGGRIVASLLPPRASYTYSRSERYGMLIVLVLLFTGLIGRVLSPLASLVYSQTLALVGLA